MTESRAAILYDNTGQYPVGVSVNGTEYRLLVDAKAILTPPKPPDGATNVTVDASSPLVIGPNPDFHDTDHVIATGDTLYLQYIAAGAQGDPSEAGSKIEVIFNDGTDHIVERIYFTSQTVYVLLDDVCEARDGTVMVGNGTNYLRVHRERMSNSGQEIDAVVRGYEQ
jgi:hypothetical protein